jgi:radical SAM superfamily enzyme YgiQ (UPF0313 family)
MLTAAAMVPADWEVKYIHTNLDEVDYDEKFDIIAIGGMTGQADDMYEMAERFRQKGVYVVIGGIHATVLPEEVKQYADTVIAGEAEEIFPRFIEDYMNNKAKPFYSFKKDLNITKSPMPRFDLLEKNYRSYSIQTTRGCPHDCKFCAATPIYGAKYRRKKVDQVIEEIKFLKSVKKNPFVVFADDNMFVNKAFSYNLVEKLIPLDIHWTAQSDVTVGRDRDFLNLLSRAGCKELFIGFESMTPGNIADINESHWKSGKVKEYKSIVKNIRESGIRIYGSFIIGFDRDTKEDFEKIKNFVLENEIIGQFCLLTPFPGSKLYEEFKRSGRIMKNKSWKYFNGTDCVINHPRFSADELEKAAAGLYDITYSQEHFSRVFRSRMEILKKTLEYPASE